METSIFTQFHLKTDLKSFPAARERAFAAAPPISPVGILKVNSHKITPHTGHAKKCGLYDDDRLREGFDLMRAAWASLFSKKFVRE